MPDALAPLLAASNRSGPPGSPNLSPTVPDGALKKRVVQKPDGRYLLYYEKKAAPAARTADS